ncbi:MAG TPA: M48 family metalloprotease [Armatimonadota bacterium]|jgi:tetratricopeptide (TPR) repeat protein
MTNASARPCYRRRLPAVLLAGLLVCGLGVTCCRASLEEEAGEVAARYYEEEYGVCHNPTLLRWVREVGAQVSASSARGDLKCRFGLLNSGEINAFTLPGGRIYCDVGLLGHVDSDDELAGVLAHEVGHVQDRDFQRIMERQTLLWALGQALAGRVNSTGMMGYRVAQLLDGLGQSRRQEAEADREGARISLRAGYDPQGVAEFLGLIAEGQSRWSYWQTLLATHPESRQREASVRAQLGAMISAGDQLVLAEQLAGRARYARAAQLLEAAEQQAPELASLPAAAARVYQAQGREAAAREALDRALRLDPANADAQALREQLPAAAPAPAATWEPGTELRRNLDEAVAELSQQDKLRRKWRAKIASETTDLRANADFNQALEAAQVVAVEPAGEGRYLLVAQAASLLLELSHTSDQLMEMRWLEYDLPDCLVAESRALAPASPAPRGAAEYEAAAASLQEALRRAATSHVTSLQKMAEASASLRRVALEISPVFLALLTSGADRPWGRLVFSRYALVQGEVEVARATLKQARREADGSLRELCAIKQALYQAQLARLGAGVAGARVTLLRQVVAQIVSGSPAGAAELWRGGDLGAATLQALLPPETEPGKEKAREEAKGPWDDEAYARYVLLRLAARRCTEELAAASLVGT